METTPITEGEKRAASTDCKFGVLQTQHFQIATYFCITTTAVELFLS
jgi:hypothetical protein